MGDVDGAAAAAMGHVDGVGLTGLSDLNEIVFIGNGGVDNVVFDASNAGSQPISTDPSALYEYSTGAFGFYVSVNQPNFVTPVFGEDFDHGAAIAASYTAGNFKLAIGYEMLQLSSGATTWDVDQITVGADATFGALTFKARLADGGNDGNNGFSQDNKQWAVSATYAMDALALTAFASDQEYTQSGVVEFEQEAYGLGASYDLGGGAKVAGGYVKNQTDDTDAFDLGLSFSF